MRILLFLLRKEYLQIFRDRLIVLQLLLVPMIQLAVLANAATYEDRTAASRGLVAHLAASGRFVVARRPATMVHADDALMRREVDAILRVPRDFERDVVRAGAAPVQLVLNAENGAAAAVSGGYAQQVVRRYADELQATLHAPAVARGAPRAGAVRIEVRTRGWYNASLDYRHYMVPGILVQLVTVIGTLLTALNIVREKELGTLEQLNVTPLTRTQFIAAKLIPLWSLALVALALGLLVGTLLFGVPVRGGIPLVFGTAAVYLVAVLGIGLLISTIADTQQQAMFVTFFVVMIYLLMSGLFTPVRSMPPWAQLVAQANPMMHYVEVVRGIMLKGAGVADVAGRMAFLAAFGAGVLALAVRQYRRTTA
jgi:ABC-2 type transport system permease protein